MKPHAVHRTIYIIKSIIMVVTHLLLKWTSATKKNHLFRHKQLINFFLTLGELLWSLTQQGVFKRPYCISGTRFSLQPTVHFLKGPGWFFSLTSFLFENQGISISACFLDSFHRCSLDVEHWEPRRTNCKKVALSIEWPTHPKEYILINISFLSLLLNFWLEKLLK